MFAPFGNPFDVLALSPGEGRQWPTTWDNQAPPVPGELCYAIAHNRSVFERGSRRPDRRGSSNARGNV